MPVQLVDLHEDFSALSHQTRHHPVKPDFAHRHPKHSLGDVFPINDYVGKHPDYNDKVLASDAPALKKANVLIVLASIYCNTDKNFHELYPWHKNFYTDLFKKRSDILSHVTNSQELKKALINPNKTAVIQSVEGIYNQDEDLSLIDKLWEDGIRSIIPIHNDDSNIGTGCLTTSKSGLTIFGKQFTKKAAEKGFIIDLSHMSDQSTLDTLKIIQITDRPPILSHTGSRSIVPDQTRSIRDDIALEVAKRAGIIGIMPARWLVESNPDDATVNSVIRTISHFLNLFWKNNIPNPTERLAIGTDFCGMGTESVIKGLETIEKLSPALQKAMKKHKYPKNIIEKILSKNAINFLLTWLPEHESLI